MCRLVEVLLTTHLEQNEAERNSELAWIWKAAVSELMRSTRHPGKPSHDMVSHIGVLERPFRLDTSPTNDKRFRV